VKELFFDIFLDIHLSHYF